jgi:DNA invertase Pin-like site-specific DNA recombinase
MIAAVYLRISSDREGNELGVERQEKACRQLAKRRGWKIGRVFKDNDRGASSLSKKPRPDYEQMLEWLKAGHGQGVVAYSTSRLTRRPREFEDLIELANDPWFVEFAYEASPEFDLTTADGQMVARVLAANDAAEVKRMSERLADELRQRAEQGRYHGGHRAYGIGMYVKHVPVMDRRSGEPKLDAEGNAIMRPVYDQKRLVPEEAKVIEEMADKALAGRTLEGIGRDLNERGIQTVTGREWTGFLVRAALLNTRVAGFRQLKVFNKETRKWSVNEYPTPNPAILSREVWDEIFERLNHPGRRRGTTNKRMYLGAGVYICEQCDRAVKTFYDTTGSKGNKTSVRAYKCHMCNRRWRAERIDEFVTETIRDRLRRPDVLNLIAEPAADVDVPALQRQIKALQLRRKQLTRLVLAGTFTDVEITETAGELDSQISNLKATVREAMAPDPAAEVVNAPDPSAEWSRLITEPGQIERAVIALRALARIVLGPAPRGRSLAPLSSFVHVEWGRGGAVR